MEQKPWARPESPRDGGSSGTEGEDWNTRLRIVPHTWAEAGGINSPQRCKQSLGQVTLISLLMRAGGGDKSVPQRKAQPENPHGCNPDAELITAPEML